LTQDQGPRTILVMDTSTERAAIALATDTGGLYVSVTEKETVRRHGRDLIPRIGSLLKEAGLRARDLHGVAVGLGPGSYTGLRVGVTAAKTLAYASGAGLIGFNSLHAVGRNAPAEVLRVSVLADAQRGDVYVADLFRTAPGSPLLPSGNTVIESVPDWLARQEPGVLVLGPALTVPRIRAAIPDEFITPDPTPYYPHGDRLAELARDLWASGRRDDPWLLEPWYLRRSAAEDQFLKSLSP
jgi:tRNA threonylcarbamoyladenosine biosynthesis protein TsaB